MRKALVGLIFALLVASCAAAPAIVPDKPQTPDQCFEGPFNIHRVVIEEWEPVHQMGAMLFLQNPVRDQYPKIVVVIVNPAGGVLRYGYLDDSKFRSFTFDQASNCYKEEAVTPDIGEKLKTLILNLCKERQCSI